MAPPVAPQLHTLADTDTVRWEGKGVKATQVGARLLGLRQEASDVEGFPLARASVMNLLVFVADASREPLATHALDELALRHPARGIIIEPIPGQRFGLDAEVAVHRHPLASHGLVYERAVLRVHGADPEGMDTLVIPLLIPHLQSFLWWLGDPSIVNPGLRSLGRICDRLIIDSKLGPADRLVDVALELGSTAALGARADLPSFGRLVIGDTNWMRLDGFRQTLAAIFDEGHRAEYLAGLRSFEVVGARGLRHPATAAELLMLGWVSSRIGCSSPAWVDGGVSMRHDAAGHRIHFSFSAGGAAGRGAVLPPIHAIRLEAEVGRRKLQLELTAHKGGGLLHCEETGVATVHRSVPLSHPNETEAVSRELARLGRDRVYEDSVQAAALIYGALTS
ncbi:MAG TPA: glucose-6-phosphate dehydrogenase assembly protein OpcA [Candidatus Dormibacteraeota bacterium]|nr:glucose-6-phosphate dehydrogenase assembly protein OpcA [Candidatus Dormibacteraeota bacterium]